MCDIYAHMYERICMRERERESMQHMCVAYQRDMYVHTYICVYTYIGNVITRQCDGPGPASPVHELTATLKLATATSPYAIVPCAPGEGRTPRPTSPALQTPKCWRWHLPVRLPVWGSPGVFFQKITRHSRSFCSQKVLWFFQIVFLFTMYARTGNKKYVGSWSWQKGLGRFR